MSKDDLTRKLSSRKFWACVTAVVVSLIAFTKASPETVERIVALIAAVGGLCIYMLSEGMADAKPESTTIHVNTEDLKEDEGDM
jgi:hypothetical protein